MVEAMLRFVESEDEDEDEDEEIMMITVWRDENSSDE